MPETARSESARGFKIPFWAQVLLGLGLGLVLGLLARQFQLAWLKTVLATVGSSFVGLLQVVVVPLVLTAIIVSIANLRQVTNAAKLAVQTLVWFAITALIAVVIGMTIGLITNPGLQAGVDLGGAKEPSSTGSWLDFLKSILPANILGLEVDTSQSDGAISSSLEFNVLQLVVIGIVVGAAALSVGKKAEPFLDFTRGAARGVPEDHLVDHPARTDRHRCPDRPRHRSVRLGSDRPAGRVHRRRLHRLRDRALRRLPDLDQGPWAEAVEVLRRRLARDPVRLRLPVLDRHPAADPAGGHLRNLGVSENYASFAVPIGATTKMDGCAAIYPALAAITVAQLFGIQLGLRDYLLIAFVSVVGSAATAGLTGAVVMLTLTLSTLGLPLEGVGLLLAIDPILDMMRTATNVAGQALVPVLVAKRNGLLDEKVYNSASVDSIEREPATVS